MSLRPLIAICGSTGVGKSKLAIELALHLSRGCHKHGWKGARIINADAMQVYAGMDLITNKVPQAEMQGIEHLLMSFRQPGDQYVVGQWVQDAMKVIEETHMRHEIPIVVGGTSYWIQHLMFPNRLAHTEPTSPTGSSSNIPLMSKELTESISSLPSNLVGLFDALPEHPPSAAADPTAAFSLHALLTILDPMVAARWHWRDTRKVLRSLCIIKETGRKTSEMLAEQSRDTVKPRYQTLCFWLYAEPSALTSRLNARVDKMIEDGLLNEIRSLRDIAVSGRSRLSSSPAQTNTLDSDATVDYTLGIYQSIGYKEFYNYLNSPHPSEKAFNEAVENMKLSTRRYAKRQISWIRNKLLPVVYATNAEEMSTPTYLLDATELGEKWTLQVRENAVQISEGFLEKRELPDPSTLSQAAQKMLDIDKKPIDPNSILGARRKMICSVCTVNKDQPVMIEEDHEWEAHRKTRLHRRLASKASRELTLKNSHEKQGNRNNGHNADSSDLEDVMLIFS